MVACSFCSITQFQRHTESDSQIGFAQSLQINAQGQKFLHWIRQTPRSQMLLGLHIVHGSFSCYLQNVCLLHLYFYLNYQSAICIGVISFRRGPAANYQFILLADAGAQSRQGNMQMRKWLPRPFISSPRGYMMQCKIISSSLAKHPFF